MKRRGKFRTKFKRYGKEFFAIRRPDGVFSDIQSIGKSIFRDSKTKAKRKVKPGQGFRGDLK